MDKGIMKHIIYVLIGAMAIAMALSPAIISIATGNLMWLHIWTGILAGAVCYIIGYKIYSN